MVEGAVFAVAGAVLLVLSMLGPAATRGADGGDEAARAAVERRFARTPVDDIACDGFGPLCQVVAGKTVFYVDPDVRHAFVGRLYDLDAKRDLTQEALARIAPAHAEGGEGGRETATVDWTSLPFDSAVVRNEGGARRVAVFSDLHCGYCARLSAALDDAPDIEAREFLIGRMGSEAQSRAIGCAGDPAAALAAYYRSGALPDRTCDRDIVAAARDAAEALGLRGTPTFVRPDGAVTSGFRDIETLRAWLRAGVENGRDEG